MMQQRSHKQTIDNLQDEIKSLQTSSVVIQFPSFVLGYCKEVVKLPFGERCLTTMCRQEYLEHPGKHRY